MSEILNKKQNRRKFVYPEKAFRNDDEPIIEMDYSDLTNGHDERKEQPPVEPAPPARTVGKRIKTAKVPFDPSPEIVPRRRLTIGSPKDADDGPVVKKQKPCKTDCERCSVAAKEEFAVCCMCQQTRIHVECLSQRMADKWQCKSCRDMVSSYISSTDRSAAIKTEVFVKPVCVKPTTVIKQNSAKRRKPRRPGFAGFSPNELQRDPTLPQIDQLIQMDMDANATLETDPKSTIETDSKSNIENDSKYLIETDIKPTLKVAPKSVESVKFFKVETSCTTSSTSVPIEEVDHKPPTKRTDSHDLKTPMPSCSKSPNAKESTAQAPCNIYTPAGFCPFGNPTDIVPYANDWSVQQVFEYFFKFFPDTSYVFLDWEIDGPALLLMKRQHMLKMVNHQSSTNDNGAVLNFGTVIKMYTHVVRLQTQSNDIRLSWNTHAP